MKHFCSFSEAIREGAKIRPQGFGEIRGVNQTCALGAGYEAMQIQGHRPYFKMMEMYSYMSQRTACPVLNCQDFDMTLTKTVTHLNDDHQWTREAIADWLESEEEKLGFVTLVEIVKDEARELAPLTT